MNMVIHRCPLSYISNETALLSLLHVNNLSGIFFPEFWVRCSLLAGEQIEHILILQSLDSGIGQLLVERGRRGRSTYLHDNVYKSRLALFHGS